MMASQISKSPTNKVIAGAVVGAAATIIVWSAKQWGHVDVPAEIALALNTVLSFIVGYFTPPAENDSVQP